MRNPTDVLNSLSDKSKNPEYRFQRLYRNLYNPDFYLLAYKNIYANGGSMTPGVNGITIDGMSSQRIAKLIESLKDRSYQPNPARRTYIAKKNNPAKKRPLGIPSGDDKLVQEVIRMLLESIYEPNFSDASHGFRPQKSCHTALTKIQKTFTGAKWFVEGDIKACFDSFDHHVLIDILHKRIDDEAFISLMWKFLKAGYMEQWQYHMTYSGTPQGSGMSPILANIYLNELDRYMGEYKARFYKPTRTANPAHRNMASKIFYYKAKNDKVWDDLSVEEKKECARTLRQMRSEQRKLPTHPVQETSYKAIQYVRYADDFIVGVIGSHEDAKKLKQDLTVFLKEKLGLTLSTEKTKITNTAENARFLGYDISVSRSQDIKRLKNGKRQRVYSGVVQLRMPLEKWTAKLLEYGAIRIKKDESGKERWKTMPRGKLINRTDIEILSRYNSEIRGLYNYYAIAGNVSTLNHFSSRMKYSMLKTFGSKYRCKVRKIKERYVKNGEFTVAYKTKSGMKESVYYHDGFRKKTEPALGQVDMLDIYKKYDKPNSLAIRLHTNKCELCGMDCDGLEMHQVRRLKDLNGEQEWERIMLQRRRKTLAVCPSCHIEIHNSMKS
ncbi:maturase [Oscillospiraceae bacterium]|nr:maturase [Oscillospiraceae bacterium]